MLESIFQFYIKIHSGISLAVFMVENPTTRPKIDLDDNKITLPRVASVSQLLFYPPDTPDRTVSAVRVWFDEFREDIDSCVHSTHNAAATTH